MFIPKNLEDLKRMVEEHVEETTQLEFKRQLPESGKNDDLAKDICAMANTEGGVIIYGVEQGDMGQAKKLHPLSISGAAERVALVASSLLDEPLDLDSVNTIQLDDQSGFLTVVVPRSERAPHFFRGTAWGRTPKGITPLTRRRIGELFARSPGFAEEFGLIVGRPGRVLARLDTEPYQETDSGGRLRTRERYYLVFENDGETDAEDVSWEWVVEGVEDKRLPHIMENPFPVEVMPPGAQMRVPIICAVQTVRSLKIQTRWRGEDRKEHEQTWPIVW